MMTALELVMGTRLLPPVVINEWWPRFMIAVVPIATMRFCHEHGTVFTYSVRDGDERWESIAYPDGHEELDVVDYDRNPTRERDMTGDNEEQAGGTPTEEVPAPAPEPAESDKPAETTEAPAEEETAPEADPEAAPEA